MAKKGGFSDGVMVGDYFRSAGPDSHYHRASSRIPHSAQIEGGNRLDRRGTSPNRRDLRRNRHYRSLHYGERQPDVSVGPWCTGTGAPRVGGLRVRRLRSPRER